MRIKEIDISRGIAIILVVLGHSIGDITLGFNKFILAFHMPLFFFLSGMTAKKSTGTFNAFIKKKAYSFLIPQITLGVLCTLYEFVIKYWLMKSIKLQDINLLQNIFRYWFLLVLFFILVIWELLNRIMRDKRYIMITCIIIWGMGILLCRDKASFLYINIIPHTIIFFELGNLFSRKKMLQNNKMEFNGWYLFGFPVVYLLAIINKPVLMYKNQYGIYSLFFINSIIGIYLIINISKKFIDNSLLELCGQNSIIIYVTHFFVIDTVRGVVSRVININSEGLIICIIFLITCLILIPTTYVCNKYFRCLFGK